MSADVTALKRGKGGNSFPLHSFKNEKTKTRRETINRAKVAKKKVQEKALIRCCGYFAPRDLYIYMTLEYNKIIEMQYFM